MIRRLPGRMLPLQVAVGVLGAMIAVHAEQKEKESGAGNLTRAVFTDKDVFLLAGAEMIAGPEITGIHAAPAGRWVIAERTRREMTGLLPSVLGQETHGEVSLLLWDSRTRRTITLWKQPFGANQAGQIEAVQWLPRSERALVVVRVAGILPDGGPDVRRSLLLVDAARPTPRVLATLAEVEELIVSPMQPLAVLRRVTEDGQSLRIVGPSGNVGVAIPAPEKTFSSGEWSPDGYQLFLRQMVSSLEKPRALRVRWHALNLGTGTIRALEQPPSEFHVPSGDPLAALPVRLKESTGTVAEEGTKQTLRPLWLVGAARSEMPRALVAPDCREGALLPDGSAAIYLQGGALYAVPLVRVGKAAFLAARREAQKEVALRNAKQLGLGLMMYAQDYDEVFPPAKNVTETVSPYLRNDSLFNNPATNEYGFVYLLDGNEMASIEAPAQTVIGYLSGPGGRAVLYADGHVTWEDN